MQHASPSPTTLWSPAPDARRRTRLGAFMDVVADTRGAPVGSYEELWQWSIDDLDGFWSAVWEHFGIESNTPHSAVRSGDSMPGTIWFPGASVNYAQHALRGRDGDDALTAIVGRSQSRADVRITWADLRDQVARARAGLVRAGIGHGDRVAAYLPNIPETIVAFLATASLGAIWTSCAPEFGAQAVLDRFSQVGPTVLLAVDGYRYGARDIDRREELAIIRAGLPTLRSTVLVPYGPNEHGERPSGPVITWDELLADTAPLEFATVAADHPLYVLYSSGTTGLPKAIVHGHMGITLEHFKVLALHADMGADDCFLWFTTTGWMMWNYLVSGLLVGATVVTFDGDPMGDGPATLWDVAAQERVTWFGVGAPSLTAGRRAGLRPRDTHDLSRLRAVGSTGSPLPAESAVWVYEAVKDDVLLSSISGGTDICSAFVGGSPLTPVWAGEIPCRYLGAAVDAFDPDGKPVREREGELVVTRPMPSMPLGLWGDDDGSRYHEAYFSTFPGIWRHGDWITITDRGSCIISGRADATLNRGGVRIGTAEIYRVVEAVPGVVDSLVVHLEDESGEGPGQLVLFVALAADAGQDGTEREALFATIKHQLRAGISPRHVPDAVHVVPSIPTTLSGKKLEVPVKRVLRGADPDAVASRDSLRDPASLTGLAAVYRQVSIDR